jgi:[acyl-carrier-protein] S-malonyltransferase
MSTAWIFGGHGGQYAGMGRYIMQQTAVGRAWLEAAERISGLPLGRLALQGPERALIDPAVLEPLLAAVSGAWAELLMNEEGPPAAVAASSAGHVAALYAAGVVDRDTSLSIACIRGAALSRAATQVQGGMVAVHGLAEELLVAIAEDDDEEAASIAARNAPTYVVYSGAADTLARAAARASHAGAVTAPLEVAGPWHSPFLAPASQEIEAAMAGFRFAPARVPVWSSVTALATDDPDRLRWCVGASVRCTIEWHATVSAMLDAGIHSFVEVSPGRSLYGLLGQVVTPRGCRRRYVECQRGPARRRRSVPIETAIPELILSQQRHV